jgi:T5SS/PEP-CTERM-associated repeat protein
MTMLPRQFAQLLFLSALSAILSAGAIRAQTTFHWLNTGGGSYHTAGNWTPAGGPPIFDDFARFGLSTSYTVSFANAGTQTIDFNVSNGNVTFAYLNPTAIHNWGSGGTNIVGPATGDANSSATLNLTSMFHNPMRGGNLIIGQAAGKTGTLNIFSNGHWQGWAGSSVSVGVAGIGNLNISTTGILQKAILEGYNVSIGDGGIGNASVSGFNASMLANNVLSIGSGVNSTGNLSISNQGKVTVADSLFVGVSSLNDNKVTVSGAGSELILGNDTMNIGFGGRGTLRIENGGKVTNSNGSSMSVNGTTEIQSKLEIVGANSHFLSTGTENLNVGSNGQGLVSVTGGGMLEVAGLRLGQQAGGLGQLHVDGNGSLVNLHGTNMNFVGEAGTGQVAVSNGGVLSSNAGLTLGTGGAGTLNVNTGGQVFSSLGRVGGLGAAVSQATVNGNNSLWSMTGGLDVGWSNLAHLDILNGGNVNSNGGRLGVSSGGHGIATLQGTGTLWNTSGSSTFVLGQSGIGTLNISQGAQMASSNVSFGSIADGSGSAAVFGNGSQWSVGDTLRLGDAGSGTMNIHSAGKLALGNGAALRIGDETTASGNLEVTGPGSQVTLGTGASLTVGRLGSGNLSVTSGAVISGGKGTIASGAGSSGNVLVRHANSLWNMTDELTVGLGGQAKLNVENGAKVSSASLMVGQNAGSTGEVVLSGLNTSLTTTGNVVLGGNSIADGGAGLLQVNSGTTASIGNQLTLWSQGRLELNGGRVVLTQINDQGGQFDWQRGTVEFRNNTVLNDSLLDTLVGTSHTLGNFQTLTTSPTGGLVIAPGHFTVDGGKVTGNNFTNVGTTSVVRGSMQMNGNFLNDVQGTFVIGGTGQASFQGTAQNNGSFVLDGPSAKSLGGVLTNNGTISGTGTLAHQVNNHGSIQLNTGDNLTITSASMSNNQGHIQLADGRLNVSGQITNEAGGLITGHGVLATSTATPGSHGLSNLGTIAVGGNNLNVHGDVRNIGAGRVITSGNSTTTFWDDVEHNGIEIRTAAGSSTVFYGSVTGAASYTGLGTVFFEGDLKPGNSPADVLFEGDLVFGQTAALNIELGGVLAGLEHDQLTLLGQAWLHGTLSVDFVAGFLPAVGDRFTIIENLGSHPLLGQFNGLTQGSSLTAGNIEFTVDYFGGSGQDLVLTAIPEPSSALFLSLGSLMIWLRMRRKSMSFSDTSR